MVINLKKIETESTCNRIPFEANKEDEGIQLTSNNVSEPTMKANEKKKLGDASDDEYLLVTNREKKSTHQGIPTG